ncbi:hypothetical protein TSUD_31420 [Trifolium subterraneum]|uniref:Uncharacterized protein n=1 Tax=Trifolium subterraneum TaxID=3900 RepID=A0A2Z6N3L1_TRISU|nr:hypothetical protein TSUD_31420 [Trifolium subterraneum]
MINEILTELSNFDLPFQRSRRSVLERFTSARENVVKEQSKAENDLLKQEMDELKDSKRKTEQELLLEKHRCVVYPGRSGMEKIIKAEIAKEKYVSGNMVVGRYDQLQEALLDLVAKYFHDE